MYITHYKVQKITGYCITKTEISTEFVNNLFHYSVPHYPHIPKVRPLGHCFAYLQGCVFFDTEEN